MWGLDERYGSGLQSLALAPRNASATGAEMTVEPGSLVDAALAVGAYTDGSHVVTIEFWNGSSWDAGTPQSGSGTLPTINSSGLANGLHLASFLVPAGCTKVRAVVSVVNATTGAWAGVLIRSRQMILPVV